MSSDIDLQDLVDNPSETLPHEFKEWLDLSEPVVRARLAKHIAAIGNHGGGYLVFGFEDDMREIEPEQTNLAKYTRDAFNGIVDRYLIPAVNCEVSLVTSTKSGIVHPVVWVPSHSSVPICSRADGPHDSKSRPQGIRQGTYYIRAPGPKSEPITTPEGWRELIRRCVLSEREGLLRDISSLLTGTEKSAIEVQDPMSDWHESSHQRYLHVLKEAQGFEWPVDYASNHYQLSYRIVRGKSPPIQSRDLVRILEQANQEIREYVWTGWSMFYPFSPEPIRPYFAPDLVENSEYDILETNLIDREVRSTTLPDFWRFSGLGYASLVRAYREDRRTDRDSDSNLKAGEWLSPHTLIRELSEFVRHALIISREYEFATAIQIQGRWTGLAGRRTDEFDPGIDQRAYISRANNRNVSGEWSIAEIGSKWEQVVATLASPVFRLFDGFEVSPEWVQHESRKFRSL